MTALTPSALPRDRDDAADDLEDAQELAELMHAALRHGAEHSLSPAVLSGAAAVAHMVVERIGRVRADLAEGGCLRGRS